MCIVFSQGNHNADGIAQRISGLQEKLNSLSDAANRRKAGLIDNSAFLQFIWKTDVVESWIADKETQVRSEDYGRDLSSVQTLLTKQVSLEIYELPPFTNCKGR
jgi:spectrin alpha